MPPQISTFFKIGGGWIALSLSLPIIPYTFPDKAYITRRKNTETTTQLITSPQKLLAPPHHSSNQKTSSSLFEDDEANLIIKKWKSDNLVNDNEIVALRTALSCYNLDLKPQGDEFWKTGFSADALQESPMFIHIGRERIGAAWRGVRSMFQVRNVTIKSLAKEQQKDDSENPTSTLFLEVQSELCFRSLPFVSGKWFSFSSSVEICTDKNFEKTNRRGITLMRHRWFRSGCLPGHVSLGSLNPLAGVFDGVRFVNGMVISSIPFA